MKKADELLERLGLDQDSFYDQSQSVGEVGAWLYACDTNEFWWSSTVYRMYGLPKTTPLSDNLFLDCVFEEDRPTVRNAFHGLLEGDPYCVVFRVRRGEKIHWLEQKAKLCRNESTSYTVGMVRDVTAFKTEQLRLERRRGDFAAITTYLAETTDTTNIHAIVTGVKHTIRRRMDVSAIAVFTREGEEVKRVIPDGMDPLNAFQFQDMHDFVGCKVAMEGKACTCRVADYPNAFGREALEAAGGVTVTAMPIRHGKKVIGALSLVLKEKRGLTHDEREFCHTICGYLSNQLNNALLYDQLKRELGRCSRLEGDWKVIFHESVDFIVIVDREGTFLQINPAFADRLGFTPDGLVGRNVFDFIHPDDRPFARYTFDQLPTRKVIRGFCNRFLYPGDKVGYLETNLKYMEETGNTIAIARDVTNLREAEARNIDLQQSITLEKMKSEFFSSLSHEFKTPLNIILSSLDLLRMKQEREDKERFQADYGKFFDYAYQNCYRLLRLTTNLLDSSRMDSQFFRIEIAPHELRALLGVITASAQGYAETRGLTIAFRTQEEAAWAACDENGVDRVVLNLLSNAIKHTSPGGHIEVSLEKVGRFWRISVADNGSGIASDFLPHIFDKFRTESSTSERQGGSGLGLFLARSLVELQNGSIWAESVLGKGSTFCFTLPLCDAPLQKDEYFYSDACRTQVRLELSDLG